MSRPERSFARALKVAAYAPTRDDTLNTPQFDLRADIRVPLPQPGNYVKGVGHGHRDFYDGYAASRHRIGCEVSVRRRANTNGRNDPKFFDARANLSFFHCRIPAISLGDR